MSKFAHQSEVKAGDLLLTDGGFTCIPQEVVREIKQDKSGRYYIDCSHGQHMLDGQLDGKGYYVGLYKLEIEP